MSNNLQNYFGNRKDLIRLSEGQDLEEEGGERGEGAPYHGFSEASLSGVEAFQELTQTIYVKKLGVYVSKHFHYWLISYLN